MDAPYSKTKPGEAEARSQQTAARPKTPFGRIAIPVAFVLCWSSGFVVPRAFAPYSEPLTFTAMRNAAAAVVLIVATSGGAEPCCRVSSWRRSIGRSITVLRPGSPH